MITPQFSVTQDDRFIHVNIRAPYIKASMMQFEVESDLFVFSLPPYYLRLHLPGQIVEDETMSSSYDLETSTVKCIVAKKTPGEHFADLEMLSKLLARKEGAKIEELDPENQQDDDVDFEEIEQQVPEVLNSIQYGFNNAYKEIIGVSVEAGNEINELSDPEHSSLPDRKTANKLVVEKYGFDIDYYFSDLYENSSIAEFLQYPVCDWEISAKDQERLLQLPKRSVIATNPKETYVGLIGLLFGQAYDMRTNLGDPTIESSWSVGKLCPLMSCLLPDTKVVDVVRSCSKRSLLFPLYRNWELTLKVWQDVLATLSKGRTAVLHRLVYLLGIFESEIHLCYRKIWLEDYTLWIQYASDKVIAGLVIELQKALDGLTKADLGLDLEEYEAAAKEALEEQQHQQQDSDDESD